MKNVNSSYKKIMLRDSYPDNDLMAFREYRFAYDVYRHFIKTPILWLFKTISRKLAHAKTKK
jgi:hypothetical protein